MYTEIRSSKFFKMTLRGLYERKKPHTDRNLLKKRHGNVTFVILGFNPEK